MRNFYQIVKSLKTVFMNWVFYLNLFEKYFIKMQCKRIRNDAMQRYLNLACQNALVIVDISLFEIDTIAGQLTNIMNEALVKVFFSGIFTESAVFAVPEGRSYMLVCPPPNSNYCWYTILSIFHSCDVFHSAINAAVNMGQFENKTTFF